MLKRLSWDRRNLVIYSLSGCLYAAACSLCSETYIQSILFAMGKGEGVVGIYGVLSQVSSIVAYILFLFDSPLRRGFQARYTLFSFMMVWLPVALYMSGILSLPYSLLFILVAAFVYQFAVAYRSSCEYGSVPFLFSRDSYGRNLTRVNLSGAICSMGMSLLGGKIGRGIFIISAAFFLVSSGVIGLYHMRVDASQVAPTIKLKELICRFSFHTMGAHVVRGFAMAGIYYFSVYVLVRITLTEQERFLLILLGVAASITGCVAYLKISRHIKNGSIAFFSFSGCAACLVSAYFISSSTVFLCVFLIMMVCSEVSSLSISIGVIKSTPDRDLPFISAARMLCTNCARAAAIAFFSFLYQNLAPVSVIVMGTAAMVAVGIAYRATLQDKSI